MTQKKVLSKKDLKEMLDADQYSVCCEQGTEAPFTGKYWDCKTPGIYHCVCCDAALFHSDTKFDSGSGWPSYWQPVSDEALTSIEDNSRGMRRIEVQCTQCGSHLGHVFPDGPEPTGLRYCINSASLKLESKAP